jgi:hypothetical protein
MRALGERMRGELRAEIGETRAGLRAEIADVRVGVRAEIGDLHAKLLAEMHRLHTELRVDIADRGMSALKWGLFMGVAQTAVVAAVVVALR